MGKVAEVILRGIEQGVQSGAQVYVSRAGQIEIDSAFGQAQEDAEMTARSIIQWYSSGKPLTAIAVAQLWEAGKVDLDDPLSRYIPQFAGGGKELVTIRHVLTHTAPTRPADEVPPDLDWQSAIRRISSTPLEPDWISGEKAGYSSLAGWFLLGEVIRVVTGNEFPIYMREAILLPLGMTDSWLALPEEQFGQYGGRIAPMHTTIEGACKPTELQDARGMAICRPGSSARGPIRELGKLYEMLLNHGEVDGSRFLDSETVHYFTGARRAGLLDHTFLSKLDWGLGFLLNSHPKNPEKSAYGYGRYASVGTFGHSGVQSSCAFADPDNKLVAAWVCNCMPGEPAHQKRQREINNAIYEELGITSPVGSS